MAAIVLDRCEDIADRGLRIADRGSRIEDRGSMIEDRGYRIEDRGSRIEDRGSRIEAPVPSSILDLLSSIFFYQAGRTFTLRICPSPSLSVLIPWKSTKAV